MSTLYTVELLDGQTFGPADAAMLRAWVAIILGGLTSLANWGVVVMIAAQAALR